MGIDEVILLFECLDFVIDIFDKFGFIIFKLTIGLRFGGVFCFMFDVFVIISFLYVCFFFLRFFFGYNIIVFISIEIVLIFLDFFWLLLELLVISFFLLFLFKFGLFLLFFCILL